MSGDKDDAGRQREPRAFDKDSTTPSEADLASVMDGGDGKTNPDRAGFEGIGEDPGVIEDSTDSAEAHDRTAGPG